MQKRAATAAAATAGGLALLLSFKTPHQPAARRVTASVTPATATPTVAAGSPPSSGTGSPPSPPSGSATKTATGSVISTPYGDVQVKATISNGKLVDVVAVTLPGDRRRSAEISQEAEPILRSEAVTAHSANIDTVSGATYTSEAYAQSLQAALDRAGA